MKKYKFRLQTVLDIKEKLVEQKLRELSEIVALLNKEVEIEKELIQKRNTLQASIIEMNSMDSPLNLFEVQNSRGYWGSLGVLIAKQRERIKNVEFFMQAKQNEVNEAIKEKKVLENLKEKEQEAFYREYLQYESREFDDIAIQRYDRKQA